MAGSGFLKKQDVVLETGDLEIGAVELKNGADDTRAKIAASSSIVEGDNVVGVQAPVLGVSSGAALDADGSGTLQQYLRGLLKAFLARIPVLGSQLAAASLSVTPASDGRLAGLCVIADPVLGTDVYLAVTGASAELGADLPVGNYLLCATVDLTFAVTNAGGGGSAVSLTSPGIFLPAGSFFGLRLPAAKRIAAITGGAAGSLMVLPVS